MNMFSRVSTIGIAMSAALFAAVPANAAQAYSVALPGSTMSGAVVYWQSGQTFVVDVTMEDTGVSNRDAVGYFAITTRSGNITFTRNWSTTGGNGSRATFTNERVDRPNDIMYITPKACVGNNNTPSACTAENQQIDNPWTS